MHVLSDTHEDRDNICIYPSSLLTYVADCLDLRKDIQFNTTIASARYDEEAKRWAEAAEDVDFVEEMREIHVLFDERDVWPG